MIFWGSGGSIRHGRARGLKSSPRGCAREVSSGSVCGFCAGSCIYGTCKSRQLRHLPRRCPRPPLGPDGSVEITLKECQRAEFLPREETTGGEGRKNSPACLLAALGHFSLINWGFGHRGTLGLGWLGCKSPPGAELKGLPASAGGEIAGRGARGGRRGIPGTV